MASLPLLRMASKELVVEVIRSVIYAMRICAEQDLIRGLLRDPKGTEKLPKS